MFTDPASDPISQFLDIVVPAYENYVEISKAKEHKKAALLNAAIQAANMLSHYRDTLNEYKLELGIPILTESELSKICPDYCLIVDVFDAYKHVKLDQDKKRKKRERLIIHRSQIVETVVNTLFPFDGETVYPRKFYGVMQRRILVYPTKMNGGVRDLLEIATNVVNFWADFLLTKGLTKEHLSFRYEGDDIITHEKALENTNGMTIDKKADGKSYFTMIARYYEPDTNSFNRWGFSEDGKLIAVKITDDAPNSRIRWTSGP